MKFEIFSSYPMAEMSTPFLCPHCGLQSRSDKTLEKTHKQIHDKRIFKCEKCDQEFEGMHKLTIHEYVHKTSVCSTCHERRNKHTILE